MSIFDSLKKKPTTTTTKATTTVDEAKKKIEALKKAQATTTVSDAKAKIDAMKKAQAAKTSVGLKTPAQAAYGAAGKFAQAIPTVKFIAKHKLTADETLSHVALKYYGSAAKKFWMLIYNHNKEVIGDNPGIVRPGMELNIPELPTDFKD